MFDKNKKNKELVTLPKKGCAMSFEFLFDKHYQKTLDFARNLTHDSFKSEDIVQEAFIRLWVKKDQLDGDANIQGYLYRIAYNLFIDEHRKNTRNSILISELYYQKIVNLTEEDEIEKRKKIDRLLKSIDELPPKCREIFVLNKLKNLKYKEVAERLNISIKTVENQIGIAFSKLREGMVKK